MEQEQETQTRRQMKIAILTPYLTESARSVESWYSKKFLEEQEEKYEFDPNNLSDVDGVRLPRLNVQIKSANPQGYVDDVLNLARNSDFVITGSARGTEGEVMSLKGSGVLVARYSIFYGGPSNYTGRRPEDGGYAFDIPKNTDTVRKLLTEQPFLEAILDRDEERIRTALHGLNMQLQGRPVLATPYLTEALMVGK